MVITCLFLLVTAGCVFWVLKWANETQLERAFNDVLGELDPGTFRDVFTRNKDVLERYRDRTALPDVSSYSSDDYPTVVGSLAYRFAEWRQWDAAVEFAEDALKIRKDPIALNALIVTATRSNNVRARQAVREMTASRDGSLLTVDLLIAQEKYSDALEELSKTESSVKSETAWLRRVQNTNRHLEIALRQKDEPAFQGRLAADWTFWFVSDDDFNAFVQKMKNHTVNDVQFSLSFGVRDMCIIAYQKHRGDGDIAKASVWQERAKLLGEAIMYGNPCYQWHYYRVIRPQLD